MDEEADEYSNNVLLEQMSKERYLVVYSRLDFGGVSLLIVFFCSSRSIARIRASRSGSLDLTGSRRHLSSFDGSDAGGSVSAPVHPSIISHNLAEEEEEDDEDAPEADVRAKLFEAIPEPYLYPTTFQRVVITETGEAPDADTIIACQKIKRCMDIREKWLSFHPYPPQDKKKTFDEVSECMSPPRPQRRKSVRT